MRLSRADVDQQEMDDDLTSKAIERFGEEKEPNPIEMMKIAMDIVEEKIFCHYYISSEALLGFVFLPILFMEEGIPADFKLIYEYYSEAGPRSINGYPIFMSLNVLRPKAFEMMGEYLRDYVRMKKAFVDRFEDSNPHSDLSEEECVGPAPLID